MSAMNRQPSITGDNGGRGADGRFRPGNKCSRGNPYSQRVARLRAELLQTVSPERLRAVVESLIQRAETGDVPAIRELLSRVLGPPEAADLLERLERLEARILGGHANEPERTIVPD